MQSFPQHNFLGFISLRLTLLKCLLLYKQRGDEHDLQQTTQRTKTKMESELSVLIIFTFEEQSFDSGFPFQSPFHDTDSGFPVQIPHFRATNFFILNGMTIAGLN